MCFVCLLGSITAASGHFRSGCRTVVVLCFRVCLVCVFLLSITTDSARLLSFRRPNRGDIVSFGFVKRVPLLPPPIPSASMHSGCRIVVILRFQLRLYPIDTHQEIGDMVILRVRVSLCSTLGSIMSFIFGFYFDLPPPVPLVPVFTGPPNYGNPGFFVAQIVFSFTTCLLYTSPSPRD